MMDAKIIERGLERTGKSKGGLAKAMGVRPGAVSEILSGIRLVKASEIQPITEYLQLEFSADHGPASAPAPLSSRNTSRSRRRGWATSNCPFPSGGNHSL